MGGKQSRVETSEVHTELHAEGEQEGPVKTSISITPGLRDQIHHLQHSGPHTNAAANPNAEAQPTLLSPEQEAAFKEQLRLAYMKGADDYKKQVEAEKKRAEQAESMKQAQLAKERETSEEAKVQQLVTEINQKKYRAPLNDVQCSTERDACLQCYRDSKSNILQCKEVADAFIRCAQQTTEKFVKEN